MSVPEGPAGPTEAASTVPDRRRSMVFAALIGVGVMAAVDQIVFHQLLGWHHFYDRSTSDVGLMSDGFLHAGELLILVAGALLFGDLRRRAAVAHASARAGLCLGLGGFQLFDGLVVHKVLRLHQVRHGVELLVYDVVWNLAGLAILAIGVVLAVRSRHEDEGS